MIRNRMDWQQQQQQQAVPAKLLVNSGGYPHYDAPQPLSGPGTMTMKSESSPPVQFGGYNHTEYAAIQHVPETNVNFNAPSAGAGGYYCEDGYPSYFEYPQYAPCDGGPGPWNFNYCYGFFGEPPCPYANVIDMEDFM